MRTLRSDRDLAVAFCGMLTPQAVGDAARAWSDCVAAERIARWALLDPSGQGRVAEETLRALALLLRPTGFGLPRADPGAQAAVDVWQALARWRLDPSFVRHVRAATRGQRPWPSLGLGALLTAREAAHATITAARRMLAREGLLWTNAPPDATDAIFLRVWRPMQAVVTDASARAECRRALAAG